MRELQLGDVIDDYCVKCKRLTNHSVVSILNAQPAAAPVTTSTTIATSRRLPRGAT